MFATKKSLICELQAVTDEDAWTRMGWKAEDVRTSGGRVWVWRYDFVLATQEEVDTLRKRTPK